MKICISLRLNNMKQTLMCLIKEALELLKDLSFTEVLGLKLSEVSNFSSVLFSSFVKASGT